MKINYITGLSQQSGAETEIVSINEEIELAALVDLLINRSARHRNVFSNFKALRAYADGKILDKDTILKESDSVTFFSPISGG